MRGDAAGAWGFLGEAARHRAPRDGYAALMTQNAGELRQEGGALLAASRNAAASVARARVELASGERVVLVLEDGRWRVDGGVFDAAGLGTPLDAVASFRRALMRRDLPGIERTLSRQTRAEWEAELRQLVEATEDRLDLEVDIQGEQARVRMTGGGFIELVRESGEWRVVDVHPP